MKKILFTVFALIGAVGLYFISYWFVIQERGRELYGHLYQLGNEEGNYVPFLSFSTAYHGGTPTFVFENDDYRVIVHEIVHINAGKYEIGFVVFVAPIHDEVPFAISYNDAEDQSQLLINKDGNLVFDSRHEDHFGDVSISYGFSEFKGYYYDFFPSESGDYSFTAIDFEGVEIIDFSLPYEPVSSNNDWEQADYDQYFTGRGYDTGFDQEALTDLYDLSNRMFPVYRNMGIYAVVLIFLGVLLFRKKTSHSR